MGEASRRTVVIIEQDDAILDIVCRGPRGAIEVITRLIRERDNLILSGLPLDGEGPGTQDIGELRQFARELGRMYGVRRVIKFGGIRTTGAQVGHRPRPIVIKVE